MTTAYTQIKDSLFTPTDNGFKLYQLAYYPRTKKFVYVYVDDVKTIEEGMEYAQLDVFKVTQAEFEEALTL